MTDHFRTDNEWQKTVRDNTLVPFYYTEAQDGRFVFADKGAFSDKLQRELSVDTLMQKSDGELLAIEEKIVRWPGYRYTAFTLETWSCTVKGRERKGWMYSAACDVLLYCFVQENGLDVLAYAIPFKQLQTWFFAGDRYKAYFPTKTEQINQTECRIVPIRDVLAAVPSTKKYDLQGISPTALKTCKVNPQHIWMADTEECPYCKYTPEERLEYARRNW